MYGLSKSLILGFGHQVLSLCRGRSAGGRTAGEARHGHGGHWRHHAVRGVAHVGHTHAWHYAMGEKLQKCDSSTPKNSRNMVTEARNQGF